jgi:hypothetical protein
MATPAHNAAANVDRVAMLRMARQSIERRLRKRKFSAGVQRGRSSGPSGSSGGAVPWSERVDFIMTVSSCTVSSTS